jgi:hypothetical protein
MLGNCLSRPAAVIWEGMEYFRESKTDWANVIRFLLKEYQGEVDVDNFTFKIAKLF